LRIAAAADADAELDHESRRGSPDHLTATRLQWRPRWTTVSELHALPNVEVDAECQSIPVTGMVCLAILLYGRKNKSRVA
jgi:hypothetical protein